MISSSVKNSSTQLATNWSMRVTQYIPACWHTTAQHRGWRGSEEDWAEDQPDAPWRHTGGPGDRGWGRWAQSPKSVCLRRIWGTHRSGRWWAPLTIRELIKTDFLLSQQQWSGFYQHGWQVKSSPMPVNWESSPTVKSIKKNKMDHRGEMGSLERASG